MRIGVLGMAVLCAAFRGLLPQLAAQMPQPEQPAFRLLGVGVEDQRLFYGATGGEPRPVRLRSSYITGPYRCDVGGRLLLSGRGGAGVMTPVAAAAIPAGVRHALVLLFPLPVALNETVTLPYSTFVMDEAAAGSGKDLLYYVNLSAAQIAVKLGHGSPEVIAPGQSRVVRYKPRSGDEVVESLAVAWRAGKERDWQQLFEDGPMTVILEGGKRIVVVFYPAGETLKAQVVDDFSDAR